VSRRSGGFDASGRKRRPPSRWNRRRATRCRWTTSRRPSCSTSIPRTAYARLHAGQGFRDAAAALKKKEGGGAGREPRLREIALQLPRQYDLNFPLLSDPDGKVIRAYGAWGEKNMYGKKTEGLIRTTVVIGPDGKVTKVFPRVKVDGHVEKVLETI
jgi:hypothetical protein